MLRIPLTCLAILLARGPAGAAGPDLPGGARGAPSGPAPRPRPAAAAADEAEGDLVGSVVLLQQQRYVVGREPSAARGRGGRAFSAGAREADVGDLLSLSQADVVVNRSVPPELQQPNARGHAAAGDGNAFEDLPSGAAAAAGSGGDAAAPGEDTLGRHLQWVSRARRVGAGTQLHPCWVPEWHRLREPLVGGCCACLALAGVLCSAGGIGGGGVYVSVLMAVGGLPISDAVPLSKAVVFVGAVSSTLLNVAAGPRGQARGRCLIDFGVCRIVVPAALAGTFVGVLLNGLLPAWVIHGLLTAVLVGITAVVGRTTVRQYQEEEEKLLAASSCWPDGKTALVQGELRLDGMCGGAGTKRDRATPTDFVSSLVLLIIVVASSVVRHHAAQCRSSLVLNGGVGAIDGCNHPAVSWLGSSTLRTWMSDDATAYILSSSASLVPLALCLACVANYSGSLVRYEGWSARTVLKYDVMAFVTGALAGMVGIGGGLIFSPFFITMGMDPSTAVATSTTCVLFTSSSTTLQYLLTDRIIVSLTVVYGLVSMAASRAGTRCVHALQERHAARGSYVSLIVAAGVLVSAVLAAAKLAEGLLHPQALALAHL